MKGFVAQTGCNQKSLSKGANKIRESKHQKSSISNLVCHVQVTEVEQKTATSSKTPSLTDLSSQYAQVRQQMDEDEDLQILMAGLRGSNMSDQDFADEDVTMRFVEVSREDADKLPMTYNPDSIARYWGKRPIAVAKRVGQLLSASGGFLPKIALDAITGNLSENEVARVAELRKLVTSLGPAYIKLGQALSIRPDILSPAAMREMQKLCDKVPSFDNDFAMKTLSTELGQPWENVYAELSPAPIAAASLGQVYKGRLHSGEQVAVKVQRPYVLETVTIDLFVLRAIGVALSKVDSVKDVGMDLVGLLDEWASRFFEELDYVLEGKNATLFQQQMAEDLPQVVVPKTFQEYTTRRVLTTSWIEGEKLSQSSASDVDQLVSIGVICYLKQLLDTGFFHADPHPGNLIRTPDGRLAILDFGLMSTVTDDIKYGMIEAISHLIHKDYEAILQDFVTLQFIPKGTDLTPILPVISRVFEQALAGGGAKSINFQDLAGDLAQITFDYPFRIPPYFALVIRAISVLEGIALVGNPNFAIVDEAFPYVAHRLLTDKSPRLRAALKYMVYGKSSTLDGDRLVDLLGGLESFSAAYQSARGDMNTNNTLALPSGSASQPSGTAAQLPSATTAMLPGLSAMPTGQGSSMGLALSFILSEQGTWFREFLMDELVVSVDALSRQQLVALAQQLGFSRQTLLFPTVFIPGAARAFVPMLPAMTADDDVAIANASKLASFVLRPSDGAEEGGEGQGVGGGGVLRAMVERVAQDPRLLQDIQPYVPVLARGVIPQLMSKLAERVAARAIREVFL